MKKDNRLSRRELIKLLVIAEDLLLAWYSLKPTDDASEIREEVKIYLDKQGLL